MACEHVDGLSAADLAEDDAVRAHTEAVLEQLALGDLTLAFQVGGRVSRRTMWDCWSWSSAESSMVMMRSPSGMNEESTLSRVVLPEPVPPEMMVLSFERIGRAQDLHHRARAGAQGHQVFSGDRHGAEAADGDAGAVERQAAG
jgi:hypothetical protein